MDNKEILKRQVYAVCGGAIGSATYIENPTPENVQMLYKLCTAIGGREIIDRYVAACGADINTVPQIEAAPADKKPKKVEVSADAAKETEEPAETTIDETEPTGDATEVSETATEEVSATVESTETETEPNDDVTEVSADTAKETEGPAETTIDETEPTSDTTEVSETAKPKGKKGKKSAK